MSIRKPLEFRALEYFEIEHEVSPAFIAEINEVYKIAGETIRNYPKPKHYSEEEERNIKFGWIAEKIFDMILNRLDILHVWYHPLIQDEIVSEGGKLGADFRVYNDYIEVKASSYEKPACFFVGCERAEAHPADFIVFFRFKLKKENEEKPVKAWLCGWIPFSELEKFPKKQYYQLCYKIPRSGLKPFRLLLQRWSLKEKG